MQKNTQISISGRVAEKFDDDNRSYIRIVCNNNNLMIELENISNISLGDLVTVTGNLSVSAISINGVLSD